MTDNEKKLIQARHRLEEAQARRAHLLTTRKRAVVWPSAIVRSPRGIAAPAGACRE